jgi:hypothetical protein
MPLKVFATSYMPHNSLRIFDRGAFEKRQFTFAQMLSLQLQAHYCQNNVSGSALLFRN